MTMALKKMKLARFALLWAGTIGQQEEATVVKHKLALLVALTIIGIAVKADAAVPRMPISEICTSSEYPSSTNGYVPPSKGPANTLPIGSTPWFVAEISNLRGRTVQYCISVTVNGVPPWHACTAPMATGSATGWAWSWTTWQETNLNVAGTWVWHLTVVIDGVSYAMAPVTYSAFVPVSAATPMRTSTSTKGSTPTKTAPPRATSTPVPTMTASATRPKTSACG